MMTKPNSIHSSSFSDVFDYLNGWMIEDDPTFLTYLRDYWLVAPSGGTHNISSLSPNNDSDFSQNGQSQFVDKVGQRACLFYVSAFIGSFCHWAQLDIFHSYF